AHLIQDNMAGIDEGNREGILAKTRLEVFELLKKSSRPEFLNRIDEIIMFSPLDRHQIQDIVRMQFGQLTKRLEENEIHLRISPEAIEWLAQLGYDPQFGARPLKRVLQKKIMNELSKQILSGAIHKEEHIEIDIDSLNNFTFKNMGVTPAEV
ncbi:MAG: type VI secretion system ATPase TssH, partial [Bacteroidota bacterium]